jgi:hypothetical protein
MEVNSMPYEKSHTSSGVSACSVTCENLENFGRGIFAGTGSGKFDGRETNFFSTTISFSGFSGSSDGVDDRAVGDFS